MSSMRVLPTMLAVAVGALLPAVAAAQPETTLETPDAPSKIATHAGVTAYSVRGVDGRWRLVYDTNSDGDAQAVPVAPRGVPFDVDLGPGTDGGVLAVYSRCRQEPEMDRRSTGPLPAWTTARGCDLYRYDFRTGQEAMLDGPSTANTEVLPTIWRERVGFVRIYQDRDGLRGRAPYVYVRDAGRRSVRQPGGGRGSTGLPGPLSLDLEGTLLAMSWTYERTHGGVSELRLGTATAGGREVTKLDGEGWRRSVARYLTASISAARVFAGFQRSIAEGDASRSLVSRMDRYTFADGELARAEVPAQLFAAVRDRRSNVTVIGTTGRFFSTRDCGGTCAIRRIERPSFETVRTVQPPAQSCGDVGYEPNTDAGAFQIRAGGVSCATARQLARDAEGRGLPFSQNGFRCSGERVDAALPYTRVTCTRGDDEVTFRRS
ncbi:MAG TPA: hypothetical protein VGR11_05480 [Solirubrobacteraceae bacterium]|nr:hypothetical protein [Solirubrobacteraceae bacterium]